MKIRCCNVDWLECYCLESPSHWPMDADYFRRAGYEVDKREYGTRVYDEMFTLLDVHGQHMIEVRRKPVGTDTGHTVLDVMSCHIRLTNAYCYVDNPAAIMREFLARHDYTFKRISRIDLCLDFERFDLGDDPQKFVQRYVSHKFAKINQANRTTHGQDRWDGCVDNYLSWGQPKSMVSTKMYNKSKELAEVKDKPYIRYAWFASGLVDDPINLTRHDKNGALYKPVIWRVEFSVKSGAAGWAIIEDCNHAKSQKRTIENTLECYDTAEKILMKFASLSYHYFHFKYYEKGQRKDRCRDKVLFNFDFNHDRPLKLQRPVSSVPASTDDRRLRIALERYKAKHFLPDVREACDIILSNITDDELRTLTSDGWDAAQMKELQLLLRERLNRPEEDMIITFERVKNLLQDANTKIF